MARTIFAAAMLVTVLVAACSPSPEEKLKRDQSAVAEATKLVAAGNFDGAKKALAQVGDRPEYQAIRSQIDEGVRKEQAGKAANDAAETLASIKTDVAGLTVSGVSTIDGVRAALATFKRAATYLSASDEAALDQKQKLARAAIKSATTRKQVTLFPVMRRNYGIELGKTLWEQDVEIHTGGAGNRTIRLIAGMFAANKNIAAVQEAADPMLKELRFSRSQFEWYRGSEFTFYDLKPPSDAQLVG